MTIENHTWPIEHGAEDYLRPMVQMDPMLDKRIVQLSQLNSSDDVKDFKQLQSFNLSLVQARDSVVKLLQECPKNMYIARLKQGGANIWMHEGAVFAYYADRSLPVEGTMFKFNVQGDPLNSEYAWQNAPAMCLDPEPIYPHPIFGVIALRRVKRLANSVPSNVVWR